MQLTSEKIFIHLKFKVRNINDITYREKDEKNTSMQFAARQIFKAFL